MAAYLLHSLAEFDEVIFELFERVRPRSILEIGSETGVFSQELLAYADRNQARFTSIDPYPSEELTRRAQESTSFDLVVGYSIPYLEQTGCEHDFVLIDGDHNYFTVNNELSLIHAAWAEKGTSGVILLHDVGFPFGRRDAYYDPPRIPAPERHRHSFSLGVTLGSEGLVVGGFRGAGQFAWALAEGGEKNGVLTAVEAFRAAHPEYRFRSIDAVFGLGALTLEGSAGDQAVAEVFSRYDNALVRRLERNRLELYLRVLELQDLLAAGAPS